MNMGTRGPHSRGVPKTYDTRMAFPEALVSTWDQVRISGKKAWDDFLAAIRGVIEKLEPLLAMDCRPNCKFCSF